MTTHKFFTVVPDFGGFSKQRFLTLKEAQDKQQELAEPRKKPYADPKPYYVGISSKLVIETVTYEEIEGTHVVAEDKNLIPVS